MAKEILEQNPFIEPMTDKQKKMDIWKLATIQVIDGLADDNGEIAIAVKVSLAPAEWIEVQRKARMEKVSIGQIISGLLTRQYGSNLSIADALCRD